MHIPDGFLSGEAALAGAAVAGAGLAVCLRRLRAEERERDLPIAGLAAAFFLVGDAPMFPITVGTQGHLLGGALAVCLLGPWLGAITIAVVTTIQALALGDGGISTLGLTIVTLALVPAFAGYPLAVALRATRLGRTPKGLAGACGRGRALRRRPLRRSRRGPAAAAAAGRAGRGAPARPARRRRHVDLVH